MSGPAYSTVLVGKQADRLHQVLVVEERLALAHEDQVDAFALEIYLVVIEDSDDLAMMFQGAYQSQFYRALRDALHAQVEGAREQELTALWRQVEALEKTSATANPTPLWTCC